MLINCPNCSSHFKVVVQPVGSTQKSHPSSPITSKALRSVQAFMRQRGPGDYPFRDLVMAYHSDRLTGRGAEDSWPALNDNAFSRALTRNGAQRWRTAKERFYTIPEISEDQAAAKPAPTVRDKIAAQAYQSALTAHTGMTPTVVRPSAPLKPAGVGVVDQIVRERREAAERERLKELAELHGQSASELPPF
jgi:hypothetical protein